MARREGNTVLYSVAGEKGLEAKKKKIKMEGGRSGRIRRNKRGRAMMAAGCGDFRKSQPGGNEGWVTAELLEGDRLDGALEMRLFQAWLRIRIT